MVKWRQIKETNTNNDVIVDDNTKVFESVGCNKNNEYIRVTISRTIHNTCSVHTRVVQKQTVNNRFSPHNCKSYGYELAGYIQVKYNGKIHECRVSNYKYELLQFRDTSFTTILKAIGAKFENADNTPELMWSIDADNLGIQFTNVMQINNIKPTNSTYGIMIFKKGCNGCICNGVVKAKSIKEAVTKLSEEKLGITFNSNLVEVVGTPIIKFCNLFKCGYEIENGRITPISETYYFLVYKYNKETNIFELHNLYTNKRS